MNYWSGYFPCLQITIFSVYKAFLLSTRGRKELYSLILWLSKLVIVSDQLGAFLSTKHFPVDGNLFLYIHSLKITQLAEIFNANSRQNLEWTFEHIFRQIPAEFKFGNLGQFSKQEFWVNIKAISKEQFEANCWHSKWKEKSANWLEN